MQWKVYFSLSLSLNQWSYNCVSHIPEELLHLDLLHLSGEECSDGVDVGLAEASRGGEGGSKELAQVVLLVAPDQRNQMLQIRLLWRVEAEDSSWGQCLG